MLEWVLGNLPGFVAVLIAFGFIIFIHELGHFLVARRVGIRCPRFAIGFGPRLFSFEHRGTEFSICLLPFGGFVQMLGEDPGADESQAQFKLVGSYVDASTLPATREEILALLDRHEAEVPEPELHEFRSVRDHVRDLREGTYQTLRELEGNFNDKTIPQRMAVVVGGVTMNFISALLLFWIVGALYGLGDLTPSSLPLVMKVYDGSPAAAAGLKYGDRIEAVNGLPVVSGSEMIDAIEKYPGQALRLSLDRGGQKLEESLTPNVLVAGMTFHPQKTENGLPVVVAAEPAGEGAPTLAAGDVVEAVDGKPVKSVADLVGAFRAVAEAALDSRQDEVRVALTCRGRSKPIQLTMIPEEAVPVGKIGIMPAQVTEFRFLDQTTNAVAAVLAGSPAERAGFQAGDVLYLANGRAFSDAKSLDAILSSRVGSPEPLRIDLDRSGSHVKLEVPSSVRDTRELGLQLQPVTMGLVVKHSFALIARLTVAPVIIVQKLMARALSPDLVKASMSGPIGIMQMIFELSDQGLGKFLYIVALINAAVGAFNLIPFPALDGARLLVLALGGLFGRELDYRKEAMVHQVGLFVLLAVVLLVTFMDVQRLLARVPLTQ